MRFRDGRRLARPGSRRVHPGRDRSRPRARRRGLATGSATPLHAPVITVAGTNGKGSICADARSDPRAPPATGRAASRRRICVRYNERIRIDGREVGRRRAARRVRRGRRRARRRSRSPSSSSPRWPRSSLFARARLDVAVLEVGLGGRLDAVNVVDADCRGRRPASTSTTRIPGRPRGDRPREGRHHPRRPAGDLRRRECRRTACSSTRPRSAPPVALGTRFRLSSSARQLGLRGPAAPARTAASGPARANQLAQRRGALAALEALEPRLPGRREAVRAGLAEVDCRAASRSCRASRSGARRRAQPACGAVAGAEPRRACRSRGRTIAVCGILRRQGHRRHRRRARARRQPLDRGRARRAARALPPRRSRDRIAAPAPRRVRATAERGRGTCSSARRDECAADRARRVRIVPDGRACARMAGHRSLGASRATTAGHGSARARTA